MKIQYLEIVTHSVETVCQAYEIGEHLSFGTPVAELGGARTAKRDDGSMIGVRAPMSESETPLVRPYVLTSDINNTLKLIVDCGAEEIHPVMSLPDLGSFAIYRLGGVEHGLWQLGEGA